MLPSTEIRRKYSVSSASDYEETYRYKAVRERSRERLASDHKAGGDELTQKHRTWAEQTAPQLQKHTSISSSQRLERPLTTIDSIQRLERHLTTTISDDRSHDSNFQREGYLLNALAPQRSHQPEKLHSGSSSNRWPVDAVNYSTSPLYTSTQLTDARLPKKYHDKLKLQSNSSRDHEAAGAKDHASQLLLHRGIDPELLSGSSASHRGPEDPDKSMDLIASALGVPAEAATSLETLQSYIADLQGNSRAQKPCRHQVIHRVKHKGIMDQLYLDQPQQIRNGRHSRMGMAGNRPVSDLELYLAKNPEVIFIVYRDYTPWLSKDEHFTNDDFEDTHHLKYSHESLVPVTKELSHAVSDFLKQLCGITIEYKDNVTLWAPYVAVYHNRGHALESFLVSLRQRQREQFQLLLDYIISQCSGEWAMVDDLIKRRKITSECIAYLFKPGDVVVHGKLQNARGYLCNLWPREAHGSKGARDAAVKASKIDVSRWDYDNGFVQHSTQLDLSVNSNMSEMDLAQLSVRPLRFMNPTEQETLRRRGNRIWKCRMRCFVSYHEDATREIHCSGDDRYMVDMAMYYKLHKPTDVWGGAGELEPEVMKQDEPPDDGKYPGFIFLMPPTIKAFNLKSKKWVDLQVDRIGDVVWNDEAFKSLVIKEKTKQLIQALISNHIEAERSTDLISGKGNGLVMLLHGGPGTGKTLTAESVAEIARRPLYPVTCGDIGTEPGRVETYLESVFHIGKTWGCVVLLDEADVFLEERSFENLQRNALVSVFLRALEYYDGILILTSNRVGHFDEAFKSRIQLAIRYKPLDRDQRTEIWKNFIRRLETLQEEGIDFADLKDHVPELAKKEMNGREIRNVITTGRQFIKWKRQQPSTGTCLLNYDMLNGDVIQPVAEFDEYLGELYGGNSSEQLARQDGKR